ncbi:hypothetical protein PoB_004189200 [Plakobranchus ocellatus]|uniref:Uncharacterized protein n=1 Tax=Plakobranchus ocellatus TaxID=259542 RepID=A0AAV4B8A2_9GAST|nr:hypothetical protein PoB_004189200 [Plakobranchus ocellatus]
MVKWLSPYYDADPRLGGARPVEEAKRLLYRTSQGQGDTQTAMHLANGVDDLSQRLPTFSRFLPSSISDSLLYVYILITWTGSSLQRSAVTRM